MRWNARRQMRGPAVDYDTPSRPDRTMAAAPRMTMS